MRRITFACAAAFLATTLPLFVAARQQQQGRPSSPRLSNEDLLSPRVSSGATSSPVEADARPTLNGKTAAPIRNPRSVLENALTKMAGVRSVRARLQLNAGAGAKDVVAETVKPDRSRVTAPDGEIVVIGSDYYYRPAGGAWQVTNSASAPTLSGSAPEYSSFVKDLLNTPDVTVTGRVLGEETIDGVEAVAYEFTVTDGRETGTIAASIGKSDGFLRRLSLSGAGFTMKAWFTSINENITIEKPQM